MEFTEQAVAKMRAEFLADLRAEREAREAREKEREARDKLWEKRMEEEREARVAYEKQSRREWAEIRKEWRKISGEWGGFTNSEGRMVEYEGALPISNLSKIGGMPVSGYSGPVSLGRKHREYDGMIYCPDATVLVEFKRHFTLAHARKFWEKQLPNFLRDSRRLGIQEDHAIYGAIAGASVDEDAQKFARQHGMFVIRTPSERRAEILHDSAEPVGAAKKPKKPARKKS